MTAFLSESGENFAKWTPKQRTNECIAYLENKLQPVRQTLMREMKDILPKRSSEATFTVDAQMERSEILVNLKIRSREDYQKFLKKFNALRFEDALKVLNGDTLEL